jgi:indole-3-glycerol phosphate synthase
MTYQSNITISNIVNQKRKDLEKEMELKPLNVLKDEIESSEYTKRETRKNMRSFRESLKHDADVNIICEYKPASPSKGHISDSSIDETIQVFVESGASAVSILTEERYFKGNLKNITSAYNLTNLPIIRKDFIINDYQIYQAKIAGASAVLLINGIHPDISHGIALCKELEMDYIVECRNKEDITHSLKADAEILGINNRNFQDFKVNLKTTEKLAGNVPKEIILVSESGIQGPEDAKRLSSYGVDAILVGTAIMTAKDKDAMFKAASSIINSVKGTRVDRK